MNEFALFEDRQFDLVVPRFYHRVSSKAYLKVGHRLVFRPPKKKVIRIQELIERGGRRGIIQVDRFALQLSDNVLSNDSGMVEMSQLVLEISLQQQQDQLTSFVNKRKESDRRNNGVSGSESESKQLRR